MKMDKGILTDSDMKKARYKLLYACIFLFMTVCSLVVIVPLLWIVLSGFKDVSEMYDLNGSFFPKHIDLGKIVRVWKETKFYKYYLNTFIMAGGSAVSTIIVSGLAGYVLSKLKPMGSKWMFGFIYILMMCPTTLTMVPLYMSFVDFPIGHFSMQNTYWPIWIMAAASSFDIFLFKNYFDGIPTAVVEAAKIDGASDLGIFFKMIIPMSVPVFIVVAVFVFNGQLNQFLWPYLLFEQDKTTIGVAIYKMKTGTFTVDYQMLMLIFAMLPQLIIFAIFQKQIMGGVNVGAVKG